jgi:hypothetical protein
MQEGNLQDVTNLTSVSKKTSATQLNAVQSTSLSTVAKPILDLSHQQSMLPSTGAPHQFRVLAASRAMALRHF